MTTISLRLKGAHVPAIKNNKMIARGRLITNPKRQQWMETAKLVLLSELRSLYLTNAGETPTTPFRAFATSWLPRDDSWKVIPQMTVEVKQVAKGEEGAIIEITRL